MANAQISFNWPVQGGKHYTVPADDALRLERIVLPDLTALEIYGWDYTQDLPLLRPHIHVYTKDPEVMSNAEVLAQQIYAVLATEVQLPPTQ